MKTDTGICIFDLIIDKKILGDFFHSRLGYRKGSPEDFFFAEKMGATEEIFKDCGGRYGFPVFFLIGFLYLPLAWKVFL